MALRMDPELLARLSRSGPLGQQGPPVGDIASRRKNLTEGMAAIAATRQPMPGIDRTDVSTATADGAELRLSWYKTAVGDAPGSAVLFARRRLHRAAIAYLRRHDARVHQT